MKHMNFSSTSKEFYVERCFLLLNVYSSHLGQYHAFFYFHKSHQVRSRNPVRRGSVNQIILGSKPIRLLNTECDLGKVNYFSDPQFIHFNNSTKYTSGIVVRMKLSDMWEVPGIP